MNQKTLTTRQRLGATFREHVGKEPKTPQIVLATEIDRAIDLSCRACGAMALGAGLGFPVGDSAPLRFHPQPPIYRGTTQNAPTSEFTNFSSCARCRRYIENCKGETDGSPVKDKHEAR